MLYSLWASDFKSAPFTSPGFETGLERRLDVPTNAIPLVLVHDDGILMEIISHLKHMRLHQSPRVFERVPHLAEHRRPSWRRSARELSVNCAYTLTSK